MSRSTLMQTLTRIARDYSTAEASGPDAAPERGMSRRAVLRGAAVAGAGAAALGAGILNPSLAGAAPSYPHLYSGYEGVSQGNVHLAGEYVSIDYQAYMEGGAVTGVQAAKKVVALAK